MFSNNVNFGNNGKSSSPLPANNISQQLFYNTLPQCNRENPNSCCNNDAMVQRFYNKTPENLWNVATNYQGGPGFNRCTDDALFKQCLMSQYYNYLSKNNTLG